MIRQSSVRAACLALPLLLAACGGGSETPVRSASAAPVAERKPYLGSVRKPGSPPRQSARVLAIPGLEGVIGATGPDLVRRFGPPRLDVWEGDARKLQWSGTPCVLDVYLYPAERGAESQATYVDARRSSDGQDVDRARCVASLGAAAGK